ncbi:MAG: nuclear transport factor 2 family protein [Leptolyngbyaceae cyanobacterium SL_1_1]|nr:nuclear transport factor 2 family protein [Leptolyngbyaceae cyanobacterium RM2_2_21]NJN03229.1 nuclear transport factor 2 family protein [Leptolyngbyaceae cyanobacterium RM1_1_2]NJO10944.1 nuclear transport factor 2 family protein [Leptolyngbyaceae cyanobacterium SL_1_1]
MTSFSLLDSAAAHWYEIPTLCQYFERLNQGEFNAAADLFAPEGQLQPPFEEPIMGAEAIAAYLSQEASNMQLEPLQGELTRLENGVQAEIKGKVRSPLFKVNVGWIFVLNHQAKIEHVRIRLLASIQELLELRR